MQHITNSHQFMYHCWNALPLHCSVLLKSMYDAQIAHWMTYFPMHNFCIISMQYLMTNPVAALTRVSNFAGLDAFAWENHLNDYKNISRAEPVSQLRMMMSYSYDYDAMLCIDFHIRFGFLSVGSYYLIAS